jgi:hypothetical protein
MLTGLVTITILAALMLLPPVSARADVTVDLAQRAEILLPAGWAMDITHDDFPYMFEHDQFAAEMLISLSTIPQPETLNNPGELKSAVEFVIADVIAPLPNARLLTNTGFNDIERAGFALDFITDDSLNNMQIRHRLTGIIYRDTDGKQLLYTLWAKADHEEFPYVRADIWLMQQSFTMTADHALDVFAAPTGGNWRYLPAILLLAALFLLIKNRRGKQDRVLGRMQHSFWRCPCGRLNHNRHTACRRCGTSATRRSSA